GSRQIRYRYLYARLLGRLRQVPVEALLVVPLVSLAQLATHAAQLPPGLSVHIAEEEADTGELPPVVPRHLMEKRFLAVDHFVVREREAEVFVEGVEHPERERGVMVLAVDRSELHVLVRVVHPPHLPLGADA